MRVLYDISTLGLGRRYVQSRGGSYRADRHITEGLLASEECDLIFCANHSSVAYEGCLEYLDAHPRLHHVPLIGPRDAWLVPAMRRVISRAHRVARRVAGSNVLPGGLRQGGIVLDRRIHPPVGDASPPADIFHSPGTPLPPLTQCRAPKRVLTIYDLSYTRFPEIYGPAYARAARAAIDSIRPGDWVLTSSESIRAELCEFGVAAPPHVAVVPLAADRGTFYPCSDDVKIQAVRRRYAIPPGSYILTVNSPDPRKNLARAIRAFAALIRQQRIDDLSFVMAGNTGPGSDIITSTVAECSDVRGRFVATGYIADEDLAALYCGATMFVYPSSYEGFGLPLLEAMQCGIPVIAINASSMAEVVGDAGLLVDPADDDALAAAMLNLYCDAQARERLRRKSLARAARFSWERTTQQLLKVYRDVLDG